MQSTSSENNVSRFTTLGWIALPFVILLRSPFALLTAALVLLSNILVKASSIITKVMNLMPTISYRQEWIEAEQKRLQAIAIKEYLRNTQIERES